MTGWSLHNRSQSRRHLSDADLFDTWTDEYTQELFRFAYRLCSDSDAAEDLVQETYYEVWKQRKPLRDIRSPRAWLFLILRRRYARLRRIEQRRPWFVSLSSAQVESLTTEVRGDRIEAADSLQFALDGMSDLFKIPLLMVFVQGMSCAQAAEQLDLPLGTVLSRIHRAKQKLRDAAREQDERSTGKQLHSQDVSIHDDGFQLRIGGA